jgi:hypothetical protein
VEIEDRVPIYLQTNAGIVESLKRYSKNEVIFEVGADGEGMPAFVTSIAELKKNGLRAIETELGAQARSVQDEITGLEDVNSHGILSKRLDKAFERQVEIAQIRNLLSKILFGRKKRYKDGLILILPP